MNERASREGGPFLCAAAAYAVNCHQFTLKR